MPREAVTEGGEQGLKREVEQKVQHHSIRAWSPTALLTGPCVACLCRSDGMQNVQHGMVAPEKPLYTCRIGRRVSLGGIGKEGTEFSGLQ